MKKITSLAATMALGLAFCGFCTGCAAGVKQSTEAPSAPAASASADGGYKVILNPGIHINGKIKATIEAAAASKVTEADPDKYYVENGYIANYAKGEDLPKAETARTGVTFAGWRYAVDGVPTVVTKMPDVSKLTDDLYLYAHWTVGTGSSGGGGGGGGEVVTNGITLNGKAMTINEENGYSDQYDEYMLVGVKLTAGVLTIKDGNTDITIAALDNGCATNIFSLSGGRVTIAKDGTYDFYLKDKSTGWELYGERKIDPSEVQTTGDEREKGQTFLIGKIEGTDVTWTSKGFKVNNGTVTVKLAPGDQVKIVKFGSSINEADGSAGHTWYNTLESSDESAMESFTNDGNKNYAPKKVGYYTFTVSGSKVTVSYSATAA